MKDIDIASAVEEWEPPKAEETSSIDYEAEAESWTPPEESSTEKAPQSDNAISKPLSGNTETMEFDPIAVTPSKYDNISMLERNIGGNALRSLSKDTKALAENEISKKYKFPIGQVRNGRRLTGELKINPDKDLSYMGSLPILSKPLQSRIESKFPNKAASQKVKEDVVAYLSSLYTQGEQERGETLLEDAEKIANKAEEVDPYALRADKIMERSEKINKKTESSGNKLIDNLNDVVKSAKQGQLSFDASKVLGTAIFTGDEKLAKQALLLKKRVDQDTAENQPKPSSKTMEVVHSMANMITPMVSTAIRSKATGGLLGLTDWTSQGTADSYEKLIDANVSHKTAAGISKPAGFISGRIENLVAEQGLSPVKAKILKDGVIKYFAKAAKKKAPNVIKEIAEEGGQGSVISLATEIGKSVDGISDKSTFDMFKTAVADGLGDFKEATFPMIGLSMLGLARGTGGKFLSNKSNVRKVSKALADSGFKGNVKQEAVKLIKNSKEDDTLDNITGAIESESNNIKANEQSNTTESPVDGEPTQLENQGEETTQSPNENENEDSINQEENIAGNEEDIATDEVVGEGVDEAEIEPISDNAISDEDISQAAIDFAKDLEAENPIDEDATIEDATIEDATEEVVPEATAPEDTTPIEDETIEVAPDETTPVEDDEAVSPIENIETEIASNPIIDNAFSGKEIKTENKTDEESSKIISEFAGTKKPTTIDEVLNPANIEDVEVSKKLAADSLSKAPQLKAMKYASAILQTLKKPFTVGAMDFSNLGGLNAFFEGKAKNSKGELFSQEWAEKHPEFLGANGKALSSHSAANVVFGDFWEMLNEEFKNEGEQVYRTGGDEVGIISTTRNKREIASALSRLQNKYMERVKSLGLETLPHPKLKNMPTGIGFGFGVLTNKAGESALSTFSDADGMINSNKLATLQSISDKEVDKNGKPLYIVEVDGKGNPVVKDAKMESDAKIADIAKRFNAGEITVEQFKKEMSNVNGKRDTASNKERPKSRKRRQSQKLKGKTNEPSKVKRGKPKLDGGSKATEQNKVTTEDTSTEDTSTEEVTINKQDNVDEATKTKTDKTKTNQEVSKKNTEKVSAHNTHINRQAFAHLKKVLNDDSLQHTSDSIRITEDGKAFKVEAKTKDGKWKTVAEYKTLNYFKRGLKNALKRRLNILKNRRNSKLKRENSLMKKFTDLIRNKLTGKFQAHYKEYQSVLDKLVSEQYDTKTTLEMTAFIDKFRRKLIERIGEKTGESPSEVTTSNEWKYWMGERNLNKYGELIRPDKDWTLMASSLAEGLVEKERHEIPDILLKEFPELKDVSSDDIIDYIQEFAPKANEAKLLMGKLRTKVKELDEAIKIFESRSVEIVGVDEAMKDESNKAYGGIKNEAKALSNLNKELNRISAEMNGEISDVQKKFKRTRRIDFIGENASLQNVIDLYTAHRDPNIEHFHIVYTKNGKVIQHTSWSSGAAGFVKVRGNDDSNEVDNYKITNAMKRLGADGWYMIHNHPTGNTTPSLPDRKIAQSFSGAESLASRGFLGSIILDHDHATVIDRKDNWGKVPYSTKPTESVKPKLKFDTVEDVVDFIKSNIVDGIDNGVILFTKSDNSIIAWKNLYKRLIDESISYNERKIIFEHLNDEARGVNAAAVNIVISDPEIGNDLTRMARGSTNNSVNYILYYNKESGEVLSRTFPLSHYRNHEKSRVYEEHTPLFSRAIKNLLRWHKNSAKETKNSDGSPIVFYHGTTHTFDTFGGDASNEGWLGASHYFTNNPDDAGGNYTEDGADLTNKTILRSEELMDDEYTVDEISALLGVDKSVAEKLLEDGHLTEDGAMALAKKEIHGDHRGVVMPVYVKAENLFNIIDGESTPITYDVDEEYYLELARDEVNRDDFNSDEEYLVTLEDTARDIYYNDVSPEVSGNGQRFIDAADKVLFDTSIDGINPTIIINDLQQRLEDGEITNGLDMIEYLKSAMTGATNNETGDLMNYELARRVIEEAGYDGIYMSPSIFSGLNSDINDRHIAVFQPNQVKSATGNNGDYGTNSSILKEDTPTLDLKVEKKDDETDVTIKKDGYIKLLKNTERLHKLKRRIEKKEASLKDMREYLNLYIKGMEMQGAKLRPYIKTGLKLFVEKHTRTTPSGINKLRKLIEDRINKEAETEEKKYLTKKLSTIIKGVRKSQKISAAEVVVNGIKMRVRDRILQFMTDKSGKPYAFSGLSKKSKEKLDQLKSVSNDDILAGINDKWIQSALLKDGATKVSELSSAKINDIINKITGLLDEVGLAREVWSSKILEEYDKDLETAVTTIEEQARKGKSEEYDVLSPTERVKNNYSIGGALYGTGAINIEDMTYGYEGKPLNHPDAVFGKVFFKEFDDAFSGFLKYKDDVSQKLAKVINWDMIKNISMFSALDNKIVNTAKSNAIAEKEFIKKNGIDVPFEKAGTVRLTPGLIGSLYLHGKNEANRKSLTSESGGFTPSYRPEATPIIMTDADFDYINTLVDNSPALKRVADHIFQELNTTHKTAFYETSKKLRFTPLEVVNNYFPMSKKRPNTDFLTGGGLPSDLGETAIVKQLEDNGSFKTRLPNARGVIYLKDLLEVYSEHTNLIAAYQNYAKPLRIARQMLQDTKALMFKSGRGVEWKRLNDSVEEIAGAKHKEDPAVENISKGAMKVFSNLITGALGNNPVVIARQFFSYLALGSELGITDLPLITKSLTELKVGSKKASKLKEYISNLSPQLKARFEDVYAQIEMGHKTANTALYDLYGKPKHLKEAQMKGISIADSFTVLRVVNVAKNLIERDFPELKGEDKDAAIVEKAEELVRRTQPMYTALHRSPMARSKNPMVKLTFAFTSVRQRFYGQLYRSVKAYQHALPEDKMNAFMKLINTFIFVDIANSIGMVLVDTIKDLLFRKEITAKKTLKRLGKYSFSLPYFGDQLGALAIEMTESLAERGEVGLVGALKSPEFGRSVDNMLAGLSKDFVFALSGISKATEDIKANDIQKAAERLFKSADTFQRGVTGLAVGNAKRYTYDLAKAWMQEDKTDFAKDASNANYKFIIQKYVTIEGKKYRLKKDMYDKYSRDVLKNALHYTKGKKDKESLKSSLSKSKREIKSRLEGKLRSDIKNKKFKYVLPVEK